MALVARSQRARKKRSLSPKRGRNSANNNTTITTFQEAYIKGDEHPVGMRIYVK